MTEKNRSFKGFKFQLENVVCNIRITESKVQLIDLFLFIIFLILPLHSRLFIAVLAYWISIRDQQQKDYTARYSSCMSMDSGVSSIDHEDCVPSPEECHAHLTSKNRVDTLDCTLRSTLSSIDHEDCVPSPDPSVGNNFTFHMSPNAPPYVDTFHMREKIIPNSEFITDLKTESEVLEEFNDDLSLLISKAGLILTECQDEALRESQRNLQDEMKKVKEASRQSRYKFKVKARGMFSEDEAESLIHENHSVIRNHNLLNVAEEQMNQIDKLIKAKGLNLYPASERTRLEYPVFDGESLPLIGKFLTEMETLLIKAGIPVSQRGMILTKSVKGRAKFILRYSFIEKNASFNDQARVLREHFGDPSTQILLIGKWHNKHGPIPMSYDETTSMSTTYDV